MTHFSRRLVSILSILVLGCCQLAYAQSESTDQDEVIPPKAVYKVDPVHPKKLFDDGVEGEAIIIASVDMFGSVQDPIVDRTTHDEFGIAALLAASEWIFEPATRNTVPVEIRVKIPFEFKIAFEHKLNLELGRPVFQEIDVPVIPSFELNQAPLPSYVPNFEAFYPEAFVNTGKSAAVSVEFIIDPEGYVTNPRIVSISTPGFEEAALRAVAHIKYKPVRFEGQPSFVSMMMPIQFSP